MSNVGTAPWDRYEKRMIRGPVNEMDKCTIVSIYPKEIYETKPTIQPGRFTIGKGTYEKPAILVVGPSSWWREVDEHQPLLEIPNSSVQIADSVIKDYANGLLACDMSDCMPGLFFVQGSKTVAQIKVESKPLLDLYRERQRNWYKKLIEMGDILWARSNGNPLSISDDMRLAAQELELKSKPWMADFSTLELTNCPACGTLRNSNYPICSNCKTVIDKKRYDELGLKQAV